MVVIFIALLHAIPVFLIGIHTKSRGWLITSAIVSGILAVSFGGDRYMFVDLLAIGVTVIWCWIALATAYPRSSVQSMGDLMRLRQEEEQVNKPLLVPSRKASTWEIVLLAAVGWFVTKEFLAPMFLAWLDK